MPAPGLFVAIAVTFCRLSNPTDCFDAKNLQATMDHDLSVTECEIHGQEIGRDFLEEKFPGLGIAGYRGEGLDWHVSKWRCRIGGGAFPEDA